MTRSRLRKPTSKSITATRCPRRARPQARLAEVVVLPTPPFPEVTTMISVKLGSPDWTDSSLAAEARELQSITVEPALHGLAGKLRGNRLEDAEHTRDRDQLSTELLAEDTCAQVAARASQGAASQRAVDVNAAIGHHFGAGSYGSGHDEIALPCVDALTRAHELMV